MSRGAADTVEIHGPPPKPRDVIVLGVPTFGMVSIWWAGRLYALRAPMNRIVRHVYCVGLEVGLARNEIVARALAIEDQDSSLRCSHIFFVDDDVLVHPDALLQLMSRQAPMVSGLYYAKSSVPQPLVLSGEYDGTPTTWTPGDLVPCWAHGMGLTLIEADVFRRLRDESDLGVDERGYPNWFTTTRDSGLVRADGVTAVFNQTEDVALLRRAAAIGYQPLVDTSPQAFGFHWDQKQQTAFPVKQWREYQDTGRITWDTPMGPVAWAA